MVRLLKGWSFLTSCLICWLHLMPSFSSQRLTSRQLHADDVLIPADSVRFASCPGCCVRLRPQVARHFWHLSNQIRCHDFWPSHPRPFSAPSLLLSLAFANGQGVHLPWCRVDLLSLPGSLTCDISFHVGIAWSHSVSHGVAQTVSQSTLQPSFSRLTSFPASHGDWSFASTRVPPFD